MVPITVKMRQSLLNAIDAAYPTTGEGRGQFIRNAIAARLEKMAIPVESGASLVPSRAGVGGQPTHRKNAETPTKSIGYSVPDAHGLNSPVAPYQPKGARIASAEEENPFLAGDIARAASSGSGGGLRRDPGGFPPGPGESGSGSSALRRQKISTKEPIQGVSKEAADAALDGALTAQRMQREGHLSRPARKSGVPSGSTGEQSPFAPSASGQPGAASGRAPGRSGSGAAVSSAKAQTGGGSKAVRGKKL